MEPGLRRFDIRDYLRIFTKRRWFILMVATAVTVIGGLIAQSTPKSFRAEATVLIRRQAKPTVWIGDRTSPATQPVDLALETQASIATNPKCVDRAAKALQSRTDGTRINVTAAEIKSSIEAKAYDPDQVRIIARSPQEQWAVEFANEVARAFEQESLQIRREEAKAALQFLEGARVKAERKLDQAQAEAARYQEQIGIVVPATESQLHVTQLYGYRDEERKLEAQLAAAQARLATVRGQLRGTTAFNKINHEMPNPARAALLKQLEAEQVTLTQLRARYTDNWPAVREARRRVEEIQAELLRQPETIVTTEVQPDQTLPELRAAAIAAERQVAETKRQLAAIRRTVQQLNSATRDMPAELDRLQRLLDRAEMAKTAYQNILAQLETARLNEAMKLGDAQVVAEAVKATRTNQPLWRMLVFSFALGLALGIFLAMVLEALDDTLHSPEDIAAYTDAPFLGVVPLLEESGQGLITVTAPKSPPAEAYRTLRSNIHFAQIDHPARTFLVTSAGAGEGKTLTTANLACALAQAGQQVLLIDADLRRPSLHRLFAASGSQGLTNILVGEASLADVAQPTLVPGLRLVTTGPLPPNPAEMVESQAMTTVIERARELADVVLFDSPPAIILTDAVLLSSKVERTILVAEAGQVSRDAFNEMCRVIRNARGNILGVVLNKLRLGASDYYYYYYYDYSHGSSSSSEAKSKVPSPVESSATSEDTTATVTPAIEGPDNPPPSTKRWRFNGRSYRPDDSAETSTTTPSTTPPPSSPVEQGRDRNLLDELFNEEEDKPK